MFASELSEKASLVWEGLTLDKYLLQLTNSGIDRIISQLAQQPALKTFVKQKYTGDIRQAVLRSLAQLVRNAHRAESLYLVKSDGEFSVFTAPLNGTKYQIITRPIEGKTNKIISVRPEPGKDLGEEFINRTANETISWYGPFTVSIVSHNQDLHKMVPGGIYILLEWIRNPLGQILENMPIYVGQSNNFITRFSSYYDSLTHFGVPTTDARYIAFIGKFTNDQNQGNFDAVEHVIIRYFISRKYRLNNIQLKDNLVQSVNPGVNITNQFDKIQQLQRGMLTTHLPNQIQIPVGQQLES